MPPWYPRPRRPSEPPPPPPPRVYRDTLAADPADAQFLAELRRHPTDGATRMVYADLLEQRGMLAMANFVRGTDTDDDPNDLLEQSDLAWRAITSTDAIQCTTADCPRTWDRLPPSPDDERCRRCTVCSKAVRYCGTIRDERVCTERGELAVIDRGGAPRR